MDQSTKCSPPSAGFPATASSTAPEARDLGAPEACDIGALEARDDGALDAHGYRLEDYDWVPVRRKPRNDGWSHDRQRSFIEALADCGSVTSAARRVGMSASSAYRVRRSPGGEAFAAAWDAAIQQAAMYLVDVAFDRAIHGSDEPVFDKEGRRVGRRMRQNDRLLMFLLRAHLPERYAHAHRAERPEAAPPVPRIAPVVQAIAALSPVVPSDPERLMPPEELEDALELADLCDGMIPQRLRDRDGVADDDCAADDMPLGAAFEAELEAAKAAAGAAQRVDRDRNDDALHYDDPEDENAVLA